LQKLELKFENSAKLFKSESENFIRLDSLQEFVKYKHVLDIPKIVNFQINEQEIYYKIVKFNSRIIFINNIKFINLKIIKDLKYLVLFVLNTSYLFSIIYKNNISEIRKLISLSKKLKRFANLYFINDSNKDYTKFEINLVTSLIGLEIDILENNNLFLKQYVKI
jgi:hypothetical protein